MLYLHIPFCKQACSYCNFHFSTSMRTRPAVLAAMDRELRLRRTELPAGPVPSVYFGGGTPSLLTDEELDLLFRTLLDEGYLGAAAGAGEGTKQQGLPEITLEANPDDLDDRTLETLTLTPVNRLSIGIQSFFDEDLRFMNRAHSAAEARSVIRRAQDHGWRNLSVDLIYGGQTTTDAMWADNLKMVTDLGVSHVSAYALTVEPGTALGANVARGKVADTDDARFERQFAMLVDHLTTHGFRHYEISNFCLPGKESHHNSGYWSGRPYVGVGPGAHSFDGVRTRRWNVSNNALYAKAWTDIESPTDYAAAEQLLYECEVLTDDERYNEYVMTSLRRDTGVTLAELEQRFGAERARHFAASQQANVEAGLFAPTAGGIYRLTPAGRTRADGVASDAFLVSGQ